MSDEETKKDEDAKPGTEAKSDATKDPAKSDDVKSEAKKDAAKSDDVKSEAKKDAAKSDDVKREAKKPEAKKEDAKAASKKEDAKPTSKASAKSEDEEDEEEEEEEDEEEDDEPKAKPAAKAKAEPAKTEDKAKAPAKPPVNPKAKWMLFLIVSVASLVADQGTKIWAKHSLETRRNPARDLEYQKELEKKIDPSLVGEAKRKALEAIPCDVPQDLIVRPVPNQKGAHWAPCSGVSSPVITNYWDWELSMNPGSAFGLFSGQGFARVFLSIVGFAAVGGMLWMLHKSRADQKILHWALALVAGGAVGNLIDRIVDSVVTDFILWHYHDKRWPVFNIADVVLVVGVGLMFIDIQKEGKREKEKKKRRAERAKKVGLVRKLSDD